MATKKKSSSRSPSKKTPVKATAAKTMPAAPVVLKSNGAPSPVQVKNGAFVSLRDLSKRCGISQHAARVRLNKAGVKRPGTRWRFAAASTQLAKAMKVLQETYFG